MDENLQFENLFKDKFDDFEVEPNPDALAQIMARVHEEEDRKPVVIWLPYLKAAGVALLVGVATYLLWSNYKQNELEMVEKQPVIEQKAIETKPVLPNEQSTLNDAKKETLTIEENKTPMQSEEQKAKLTPKSPFVKPILNNKKEQSEQINNLQRLVEEKPLIPSTIDNSNSNKTLDNNTVVVQQNEQKSSNTAQEAASLAEIRQKEALAAINALETKQFLLKNDLTQLMVQKVKINAIHAKKPTIIPFELYANASPILTYSTMVPNEKDDYFLDQITPASNFSTKRMGFQFQTGLNIPLTDRLKVGFGANFTQLNQAYQYTIAHKDSIELKVSVSGTGISISPELKSTNSEYALQHNLVGGQVNVLYDILKQDKFSQYIGINVGASKLLNSSEKINPSFVGVIGAKYKLTDRLNANIAFQYHQYLNALPEKQQLFAVETKNFGLNIGVSYDLNAVIR